MSYHHWMLNWMREALEFLPLGPSLFIPLWLVKTMFCEGLSMMSAGLLH